MPKFRPAPLLAAALPLLLTLASPAYSRPPTVDPTYGLPLPALKPAPTATASPRWIWAATTAGAQTVQARGTVTLAVAPKTAELFVTGDDAFTAFVNGTYKGSFACSDPALTRLWYAGAWTAHLCMQEEIRDAPKRDRGLWCGDLQVTGATINDVFADRFLMEHSIAKLRDEAQKVAPIPGQRRPKSTRSLATPPPGSASWPITTA